MSLGQILGQASPFIVVAIMIFLYLYFGKTSKPIKRTRPKISRTSKLTMQWQVYDHDYEKRVQDIRLKNGDEVIKCWPNSGKWCCLSGDKRYTKKDIPDAEVTHTRLNKTDEHGG